MRAQLILLVFIFQSYLIFGDLITGRAKLSSKRDSVGGIQVGDKYYFVGGYEMNDLISSNKIDIYNTISNEWETPILLDEPRGFISTAVVGENIYFIGGTTYSDCVVLYNTSTHNYEQIGCGPTIRTPTQISNHNSTITVLGSFSADFYDVTNKNWYHSEKLTAWMQDIANGITVIHENLIIGVGGVNVTTLERFYDAWIYDTNTNEFTIFKDITTINTLNPSFGFTVAHNKLVIFTSDRYISHQLGTNDWRENFMGGIYQAVILPNHLFLFNSTGFTFYDWSTREANWSTNTNVQMLVFENQIVLMSSGIFNIFDGTQWTYLSSSTAIGISSRWINKYVLYSSDINLRLYDSQSKDITTLPLVLSNIRSIIPFDNDTLVIFNYNQDAIIYTVSNDTLSMVTSTGVFGDMLIGRDIISFVNSKIWVNLSVVQPGIPNPSLQSTDGTTLFRSRFLVRREYPYMDVYNHITKQWQPKIFMNISTTAMPTVPTNFAAIAVLDDMIAVGKRGLMFRYNTTSGESSLETITTFRRGYTIISIVPVVNNVGFFPDTSVSSMMSVNSTTTIALSTQIYQEQSTQFVTSADNIMYIASILGPKSYSIFTYDIRQNSFNNFGLATPQTRTVIALSNDILVVLGSDGNIYAVKTNDVATWYSAPLTYDFAPQIIATLNDGRIMVAGGKHADLRFFTDEVIFINASAVSNLITLGPNANNNDTAPITSGGLAPGELATAIVVPVVVVAGGLIALVVILMKRRKRQRETKNTVIGLEERYGDWFTPFEQLSFGDRLGQGANGQVFKGKWKNTTVALKVSMTQANQSVISELELMMKLRPHPNVVQLFGFSVHPETQSIILIIEYCEGGSLDGKLYDTNNDDISLKTQLQWMIGISKGLNHLHSNNIVHRDVAARNVLVHQNEPKLTDFGMSRLIDEQQQRGTTKSELGPIRWMAPESLKNKEYSAKSGKTLRFDTCQK